MRKTTAQNYVCSGQNLNQFFTLLQEYESKMRAAIDSQIEPGMKKQRTSLEEGNVNVVRGLVKANI